ncbi:capsular polysaccharide synthesis protein-domain-containing protein [Pelagophyceae sp. CCMP2097]|nr:capsular polysaccharide synthesis protein-domain-containing protein [Pelagophyceae sp. CCMP2097]
MLSSEVSPETVPEAPEAPLLAHLATAVADAVTDAFHATLTAAKALGAPQTQTALPPTTLFPDDNTLQPLTIWIFWGDGAIPPLVRACIASWRRHNALHTVRVVSNADLETGLLLQDDTDDSAWPFGLGPFVAAAPTYGFESVQKLSNWVRLSLLERHGGVWVDASTWCTGPVERWVSGSPAPKLSGFSTRQNPRVFENWAIGSPAPKHVGVVAWRAQLREAHRIGRDVYIAKAFAEDFDLDALWKSDEGVAIALPYLWCHLAMLVAQRKAKGKFDSTMVVHDSAQ